MKGSARDQAALLPLAARKPPWNRAPFANRNAELAARLTGR
jgi:hypothetical protein